MMGRRKSLLRGGSLEESKVEGSGGALRLSLEEEGKVEGSGGALRLRAATDSGICLDKENQVRN